MEKSPTLIYCNNQSCIKLGNNHVFHDKSKHIQAKYCFIRDLINKEIYMEYCSTEDNVAGILTKSLLKSKFEDFKTRLGLHVPNTILKREC